MKAGFTMWLALAIIVPSFYLFIQISVLGMEWNCSCIDVEFTKNNEGLLETEKLSSIDKFLWTVFAPTGFIIMRRRRNERVSIDAKNGAEKGVYENLFAAEDDMTLYDTVYTQAREALIINNAKKRAVHYTTPENIYTIPYEKALYQKSFLEARADKVEANKVDIQSIVENRKQELYKNKNLEAVNDEDFKALFKSA